VGWKTSGVDGCRGGGLSSESTDGRFEINVEKRQLTNDLWYQRGDVSTTRRRACTDAFENSVWEQKARELETLKAGLK